MFTEIIKHKIKLTTRNNAMDIFIWIVFKNTNCEDQFPLGNNGIIECYLL